MTGKRMNLLNIYAQFPPMRKWMEVLPVHNQHPSCLHTLSRGCGRWVDFDVRRLLLPHPRWVKLTFRPVGFRARNRPPPLTKGQIFDPVCFCYSVLGPHSFEFIFYGIYCEPVF